jgi:16S rRNA (guanine527-N7)-methyltransferase
MLARPNGGWEPLILRAAAIREGEPPWLGACARYLDELLEWNRRTDLTAARTADELVDLTVADAAVIAAASPDAHGGWVDVGSGAGAPGLLLSMMLPAVRMTLVEPRDRRVAFLRSAIGKFGLTSATVVRGRSDRILPDSADVAVSRATLSPKEWLREGARIAKSSVWVLLAREEPPSAGNLFLADDLAYELPLTRVPRRAVRYARP